MRPFCADSVPAAPRQAIRMLASPPETGDSRRRSSTCEAIFCDCLPLLPNRLNYPLFIPDEHKPLCLYDNQAELIERLVWACRNPEAAREISLSKYIARFDWQTMIYQYDRAFQSIADQTISG